MLSLNTDGFFCNQEVGVSGRLQSILTAFLRLLEGKPEKAKKALSKSDAYAKAAMVGKRKVASKPVKEKAATRKAPSKMAKSSAPPKAKKQASPGKSAKAGTAGTKSTSSK